MGGTALLREGRGDPNLSSMLSSAHVKASCHATNWSVFSSSTPCQARLVRLHPVPLSSGIAVTSRKLRRRLQNSRWDFKSLDRRMVVSLSCTHYAQRPWICNTRWLFVDSHLPGEPSNAIQ